MAKVGISDQTYKCKLLTYRLIIDPMVYTYEYNTEEYQICSGFG